MSEPLAALSPLDRPAASPGALPTAPAEFDDSLLGRLRSFYREVLRVKYAVAAGKWMVEGDSDRGEAFDLIGTVHHHLKTYLENQIAAVPGGYFGVSLHREATYVMAALADEVLLYTVDWPGRRQWQDHLLETALFETQVAGERFFDSIDALVLRGPAADPDLAAVYLVALSLGFRGKYRWIRDPGALHNYRRMLRQIIERHGGDVEKQATPLFAEAYGHVLSGGRPIYLPHLRPWLLAIGVTVAIYLIAAHVIWVRGTAEIESNVAAAALLANSNPAACGSCAR